jgi:catechol 2,3-dioxygenase-like lactoylglutathione lyase family enzyme
MPSPRFTMVVLNVADLPRSAAFYRRLGVTFPDDVDRRRDVVVDLGGGHNLVLATTFAGNVPAYGPSPGDGRVMLEFFVDGDDTVDATYAELVEAGYQGRRPPFRTDFGAWMALVDDPDGNTVLVTAG